MTLKMSNAIEVTKVWVWVKKLFSIRKMFTQAMQYEIKDDAKGTEGKYYVQNKIYKFSVVLFLLF